MEQDKREKVIKGLECCGYSRFMDKCQECPYDGKDCFRRLKEDALALLEAQEPVEPIVVGGSRYIYCGNCHQPLCNTSDDNIPTYCEECGRAVRWE